jgi:hypothetical protein
MRWRRGVEVENKSGNMKPGDAAQPDGSDWETIQNTPVSVYDLKFGGDLEEDLRQEGGRAYRRAEEVVRESIGEDEYVERLRGFGLRGEARASGNSSRLRRVQAMSEAARNAGGVLVAAGFILALFVGWDFWVSWAIAGGGALLGLAGKVLRKDRLSNS